MPPEARRAVARARPQLIETLRTQGKFAEALKLSDERIQEQPRLVEPRLTRARILEAWARQDPKQYDSAVAAWTEIRVLLGRLPQRPPEYYEAIYRTASCLFDQWRATKAPAKLLQAQQVLKATLVQNSKLSGPEMVAQYNELLKRIASVQPAGSVPATPAAPKTP